MALLPVLHTRPLKPPWRVPSLQVLRRHHALGPPSGSTTTSPEPQRHDDVTSRSSALP